MCPAAFSSTSETIFLVARFCEILSRSQPLKIRDKYLEYAYIIFYSQFFQVNSNFMFPLLL